MTEGTTQRTKRHDLLGLVDKVQIENTPYLGYKYKVQIYRNGKVEYSNNTDYKEGVYRFINSNDVTYVIELIMARLFCYDSNNHGEPVIDGHHWKITFYKADKVIDVIEGWTNEDGWRYNEAKRIFEIIERYIALDLGSSYMYAY